jgi:hypothetical protein
MSTSGGTGGADACNAVCGTNTCGFAVCDGCCCWLPPGASGICAETGCPVTETCCIGR